MARLTEDEFADIIDNKAMIAQRAWESISDNLLDRLELAQTRASEIIIRHQTDEIKRLNILIKELKESALAKVNIFDHKVVQEILKERDDLTVRNSELQSQLNDKLKGKK